MGLLAASQPEETPGPFVLPVTAGSLEERELVDALVAELRRRGAKARRVGTVGDADERWIEAAHLGAAGFALVAGAVPALLAPAQVLALYVLGSAGARRYGVEWLGSVVPREPTWCVVAGDPQLARGIEVVPLDRAPRRDLRLITGTVLLGTSVLLASESLGPLWRVVMGVLLFVFAGVRARREVVVPDAASPEALRVAGTVGATGPDPGRLVLYAGASARAWGAAEGALDWLGVTPGKLAVYGLDRRSPRGRAWSRRGWLPAPGPAAAAVGVGDGPAPPAPDPPTPVPARPEAP